MASTHEETQYELKRTKEEYRKLELRKTAWMAAAILFMVLFALTLALRLTR